MKQIHFFLRHEQFFPSRVLLFILITITAFTVIQACNTTYRNTDVSSGLPKNILSEKKTEIRTLPKYERTSARGHLTVLK